MPEFITEAGQMIAAGVSAAGAVWLAMRRARRDIREVRHQVQNDHPSNLRDDLDVIRNESREHQNQTQNALLRIHDRLSLTDERQITTIRRIDRLENSRKEKP